MRTAVVLLAVLALGPASVARADDAPPFTVADVAPGDDERPDGWSPLLESGVVPETAPTVGRLLALGEAAGLPAGALSVRSRSLRKKDGPAAVLSVAGVDAQGATFAKALAEAAAQHGWKVRELGSPARVAVAWASEAAACADLLTWQAHLAVRKLSQKGIAMAESMRNRDDAQRTLAFVGHVLAIEPDAGLPNSLRGTILFRMRDTERALDPLRKVIAPDAPVPAGPFWQMDAAGNVGHILLLKGDPKVLAEAAKALERAVELEEHARQPLQRFGNAYNLACAYARLGRIDDAFRLLEKSMKVGHALESWASHFEHAKVKDPDLEPLRADPRFATLMKKYDPNPAPEGGAGEGGDDDGG